MKHIKLASAIAVIMGMAAAGSASAASSAGGVITFHGQINDETCTVQGGSGTDGGRDNFSVTLASVGASQLASAGATAALKPFQVIIGGPGQGTCEDGKVGSMYFLPSSPQVSAATGNLTNVLAGESTKAEIQLLKGNNSVIDLRSQASGQQNFTIANNTATLDYQAQYYATGAATPGKLETNVIYAVVYN